MLVARSPNKYVYVSNEHETLVDVYFDEVKTPGNVIQYNEYYPFGMRTADSWDRVDDPVVPSMETSLALKIDFDGTTNDLSGSGNDGTATGATLSTSYARPTAIYMDGGDYMTINHNAAFNFAANSFAIAAWVRKLEPTSGNNNQDVINKWDGGSGNEWMLKTTSNGTDSKPRFDYVVSGTTYNITSSENLTIGTWHHLAVIRSGTSLKLYVNGVEKASATIGTSSLNSGSANVLVGKWTSGTSVAAYDDIYIYNRALTEIELRYLYLDKPELMVNSYLYNGGGEYNGTGQWYETMFRGYDPVLGRMNGVDVMAGKFASLSPYNFGFNDPMSWNDPSGASPLYSESERMMFGAQMVGGVVKDNGVFGRGGFFETGWTPGSGSIMASVFRAQDDKIFLAQAASKLKKEQDASAERHFSFTRGENGVFYGYSILSTVGGTLLNIVRTRVTGGTEEGWVGRSAGRLLVDLTDGQNPDRNPNRFEFNLTVRFGLQTGVNIGDFFTGEIRAATFFEIGSKTDFSDEEWHDGKVTVEHSISGGIGPLAYGRGLEHRIGHENGSFYETHTKDIVSKWGVVTKTDRVSGEITKDRSTTIFGINFPLIGFEFTKDPVK